jgi:hypothetical protein
MQELNTQSDDRIKEETASSCPPTNDGFQKTFQNQFPRTFNSWQPIAL